MTLSDLYTISAFETDGGQTRASVRLHAGHPVFAGHFPGQPVLPGVVQVRIMTRLLERATGRQLTLASAAQIKFLHMILPTNDELRFQLRHEDDGQGLLKVQGEILTEAGVATRGRLVFRG